MTKSHLFSNIFNIGTEGLNVKPSAAVALPVAPKSLFEFLEMQEAELIKVKGLDARRIPHLSGPTFVTVTGHLCCRHGASRASLRKSEKTPHSSKRLPTCGCSLKPLPWRTGLKHLQLGKHPKKALCSLQPNATTEEAREADDGVLL